MTSSSANESATPHGWEVATVADLWRLSDATGIPASAVLATVEKFGGGEA